MTKIRVYVLNFHALTSHIEILLENLSSQPHTYYSINQWSLPLKSWDEEDLPDKIKQASSVYYFDIDANPNIISSSWKQHWLSTRSEAGVLKVNCAVAAQWFLTEFADIPKPNLSNLSWNHLGFGIIWPSFIPCPVALPGRIMSNAKFHVEARTNPQLANQYSHLFLYTCMALATFLFAASLCEILLASTILSGGIAGVAIAGGVTGGIVSSNGFFKAYNILSAKNISSALKKKDDQFPFTLEPDQSSAMP